MRTTRNTITALLILSAALLILLAYSCGEKIDADIVATFDGGNVTKDEYIEHFLLSTKYKPDIMPSRDNLEEIVRQKAFEKLVAVEAKRIGLDQDSLFLALRKKNAEKIVYQEYTRRYIVSKIITDSLVQKYYREFSPQYNLRYIIRPIFKGSPPDLVNSQKDTIEYVYKLLKQGKSFADLAKRYSQDISTRHKGGDIGWVIRESLGDEVLRAVMDTLKDHSFSAPVRGYEGFYILYKGDQREVKRPPFAEAEPNIRRGLAHNRQHVIKDQIHAKFKSLAPRYNFKLNKHNFNRIVTITGGDTSGFDSQTLDFSKMTENDLLLTLATFSSDSFNVFAVLRELQNVPETLKQFREAINQYSHRAILAQYALELGVNKLPSVVKEIDTMETSLLNSIYYNQRVKEPVRHKVDSLRAVVDLEPKEKALYIRREGQRIEKELQSKLQNQLLTRYSFRLIESNVPDILAEARSKKILQNSQQKTQG